MNLDHTNLVTAANGPRHSDLDKSINQCFYCDQMIGTEHLPDCVCRRKLVMVEVTLQIPMSVPASWTAENANLRLNGGTWCAYNLTTWLFSLLSSKAKNAPCLCQNFQGRYIREATALDIEGVDVIKLTAEE